MRQVLCFFALSLLSCRNSNDLGLPPFEFDSPHKVVIQGYSDHAMEPFLSKDGTILFFNNSNDPAINTNLHWALRVNDTVFSYQGPVSGVNSPDLDAVPSMDDDNNFYFVSTRDYNQTLSTIYSGVFTLPQGGMNNIKLVSGISKGQMGWVNFDAEINREGTRLYFVDGFFNQDGLRRAGILLAEKKNGLFQRMAESNALFGNINTEALEYAPALSSDELELYFTRVDAPLSASSQPQIYLARRSSPDKPFERPVRLSIFSGFVEAVTVSPDNKAVYFHKKENGVYSIHYSKMRR